MTKVPASSVRKSRKTVQAVDYEFSRDLDLKMMGASTMRYFDVVQILRALERQYLSRLQDYPQYALEIRRRIAEKVLEQALFHGCTLSVCRAKLKALSRLEFENIERKAHFCLLYARGALARGHKRGAKQSASMIVVELERSLKKVKSPLAAQCLQRAKELLSFIDTLKGVPGE